MFKIKVSGHKEIWRGTASNPSCGYGPEFTTAKVCAKRERSKTHSTLWQCSSQLQ